MACWDTTNTSTLTSSATRRRAGTRADTRSNDEAVSTKVIGDRGFEVPGVPVFLRSLTRTLWRLDLQRREEERNGSGGSLVRHTLEGWLVYNGNGCRFRWERRLGQ